MEDLHIGEYASFKYFSNESHKRDGYICDVFTETPGCVWFRPVDTQGLPKNWQWRSNNTEFATAIEHLYNFRDYGYEQPDENSSLDTSDLL